MARACGLILADRGTVTGMAAAAGIAHQWRRACWLFAAARWDPDVLGLAVARLVVKYLLSEGEPPQWESVDLKGTWFPDAFIGTMASVMRFVEGSSRELPTSVDDAFHTMAVVEAAYRSSDSGATEIPYE